MGILPFERPGPGAGYCLDPGPDGAALVAPRRYLFRLRGRGQLHFIAELIGALDRVDDRTIGALYFAAEASRPPLAEASRFGDTLGRFSGRDSGFHSLPTGGLRFFFRAIDDLPELHNVAAHSIE